MIFNYVTSVATISARLPARAEDPLEHGTSHAIKTVWDTTPHTSSPAEHVQGHVLPLLLFLLF